MTLHERPTTRIASFNRATRPVFLALVLSCASPLFAAGPGLPTRSETAVADFASIIDAGSREKLNSLAEALWKQAGFALVIATLPSIGEIPVEEYANRLYRDWGIGDKKNEEGALVLLSLQPRKVRIEVGYGSEGYLNDAKTGRILDHYGLPHFKSGDYATGFLSVSSAIASVVANEKGITLSTPVNPAPLPATGANQQKVSPMNILFAVIVLSILLSTKWGRALLWFMIISSMMGNRQGGHRNMGFGGGFGGSSRGFGGGFGGGSSGGGGASRGF